MLHSSQAELENPPWIEFEAEAQEIRWNTDLRNVDAKKAWKNAPPQSRQDRRTDKNSLKKQIPLSKSVQWDRILEGLFSDEVAVFIPYQFQRLFAILIARILQI